MFAMVACLCVEISRIRLVDQSEELRWLYENMYPCGLCIQ